MLQKIRSIKWSFFLNGKNYIKSLNQHSLQITSSSQLKSCNFYLNKTTELIIESGCSLRNVKIFAFSGVNKIYIGKNTQISDSIIIANNGNISIGENNIIQKSEDSFQTKLQVDNGTLKIGDYNRISCVIWIRFGGLVKIGSRNAINQRTEIRADEKVTIGDYNQISYDCVIWDTNTHNIYNAEKRREITDKQYPAFGLEYEKPKTSPVLIGNDCWIGRRVSILKGTSIGDKCVIAFNTMLSKQQLKPNSTVMNSYNLIIKENDL